jgi:hypothetical protein
MVQRITGPIEITDASLTGTAYFPSGSVTNTAFSSNTTDRLAATKSDHQRHIVWSTATTATAITATEAIVHIAQGAGTIIGAFVVNETAPTGGDLDYTVDVLKAADGSTSFSTILTGAIASPADGTVGSGTLTTTTYSQYDRFKFDINTSGSTGTNGLGVTVVLILNEAPS